jgi:HSP20 family protein
MFEYRSAYDRPLGWDELFRGFDRIFREVDRDLPLSSFGFAPSALTDEGDKFVLRVDVPGVADKDVHVELENGVLTVTAERRDEVPQGYAVRRRERGGIRFSRSYSLGEHLDPEKTTAQIKDGVLTVTVGKSPAATRRQIQVKAS